MRDFIRIPQPITVDFGKLFQARAFLLVICLFRYCRVRRNEHTANSAIETLFFTSYTIE